MPFSSGYWRDWFRRVIIPRHKTGKDRALHQHDVAAKVLLENCREELIRRFLDIKENIPCLLPFVPLMKNGPEHLLEADNRIYDSPFPRPKKSDMLTSMAILSGLVSEDLTTQLIQRRRDIMIESPAYEIFRQEWMKDGLREGLKPSLQALLEIKFGPKGLTVYPEIETTDRVELLQELVQVIKEAKTLEEVRQFLAAAE
jgi:hypothetical protein